jgi:hypothetical protein
MLCPGALKALKYRKNEVFLDVVESVNLLVSASGNVLRSEIVGAIKMRVYLSGMPELRLGLNDKVTVLYVKFHMLNKYAGSFLVESLAFIFSRLLCYQFWIVTL